MTKYPHVLAAFREHERLKQEVVRALGDELLDVCGPKAPANQPTAEVLGDIQKVGSRKAQLIHGGEKYAAFFAEQSKLRKALREINKEMNERGCDYHYGLNYLTQVLAEARKRKQGRVRQ